MTNSRASSKALEANSRSQSNTPTTTNQYQMYKLPPESPFGRKSDKDDDDDEQEILASRAKANAIHNISAFQDIGGTHFY